MARIWKPLLAEIAIGLVISLLLCALWLLGVGNGFLDALLQAPIIFFGGMSVGIIVWVGMLILARLRTAERGRGARFWWSFLAATVAIVVNLVVLTIAAFTIGGWDALLVMFAYLAAAAFSFGALLANLLTHLLLIPAVP